MDIVHASLHRRHPAEPAPDGETAEILAALWAHARPADGLQHITARGESDRTDLLLYLRTLPEPEPEPEPESDPGSHPAVQRAHRLIARAHLASPLLHRSHLPPVPPADPAAGPR